MDFSHNMQMEEEDENKKIVINETILKQGTIPPYLPKSRIATKDMNYFDGTNHQKQQDKLSTSFDANNKSQVKPLEKQIFNPIKYQSLSRPQNQPSKIIQPQEQTYFNPPSFLLKHINDNTFLKLPTEFPNSILDGGVIPKTNNNFQQNFQDTKQDFQPQICNEVPSPMDLQKENPLNIQEQEQQISENFFLQSTLISEGYDLKTSVMCQMCNRLILDPAVCDNCGSSFCYNCFKTWVEGLSGCLKCGKYKYTKKTPQMYDDLLNAVKFDCKFTKNKEPFPKCDKFAMPYKEANEHMKTCKYTVKSCENDKCNFIGLLQDLEQHRQICEFRKQKCKYCQAKIMWNAVDQHQKDICPKVTYECNLCRQHFMRQDINSHEINCPMIKVKCKCGEEVRRKDYYDHIQVCPNAEEKCQKCQMTHKKKDMGNSEVCIRGLSQRCEKIEREVDGMEADIQQIFFLIQNQQRKDKTIEKPGTQVLKEKKDQKKNITFEFKKLV